jgi:signal transduction histidine kinase
MLRKYRPFLSIPSASLQQILIKIVADVSHELRTPLTAIGGSLQVLLLKPEGKLETTRRGLHGAQVQCLSWRRIGKCP